MTNLKIKKATKIISKAQIRYVAIFSKDYVEIFSLSNSAISKYEFLQNSIVDMDKQHIRGLFVVERKGRWVRSRGKRFTW